MTTPRLRFELPDSLEAEDVERHLGALSTVRREPSRRVRLSFLDTFDWRLHAKGLVLEAEEHGREVRLLQRHLRTGAHHVTSAPAPAPRLAADLPPGHLRRELAPLLEMRALLPQARLRSQVEEMRLLDRREKTVLGVRIESNVVLPPGGGRPRPLGRRVRLVPVRGYEKVLARAEAILRDDLGLQPSSADLLTVALEKLGRRPDDYSARLNLRLDPATRADEATKVFLGRLVATMDANVPGILEDLDSEFLHDYRVAVRRTRSALGQVRGVFPRQVTERFERGFRWLGQETNEMRDLDVYLLEFETYRGRLPDSMRDDLNPLFSFLRRRRDAALARLVRTLRSARYERFMESWRRLLAQPVPGRSSLPNATRDIAEVAAESIHRVHRRLVRQGRRIDDASPNEDLHRLRRTAKKLRYLLEFSRSLYPPKPVGRFVRSLKHLQDVLGEFQDLEVHADSIAHFGEEMAAAGDVPARTLVAMGSLVESLRERQARVREEFAGPFADFAAGRRTRRLHAMLERVS